MTPARWQAALVTGGGRGSGARSARRFAAEGAAVVVADLVAERADEVASEIGGPPSQANVTRRGRRGADGRGAGPSTCS